MLCAQDNILNVNGVLKLTLTEVLSYLSYRLDKANKEARKLNNTIS